MNTVFIVPTGIGCKIGGHAGDATPSFKLIASVSNIAITHPNVVNASDINEMPDNAWYVEGSILDRFLEGKFCLNKPKSNKILLVVNPPIEESTINGINAARYTIGCEIKVVELKTHLTMIGKISKEKAFGDVFGINELIKQVSTYDFDCLAIHSRINVEKDTILNYLRNGGVNPWGGIEAIASRYIADKINKPVAHAPIENEDPDIYTFSEIVNPRMAAEVISRCYLHCVLKGLHKAPRISNKGLHVSDIDVLVSPWECFGRPHIACLENNVTILGVKENTTSITSKLNENIAYWVDNYIEAAGWLKCFDIGVERYYVSDYYIDENQNKGIMGIR